MSKSFKKLLNFPSVLLVIAALFWGGNAVAGKFLAGSVPPITISFVRISISLLIILPFIYKTLIEEAIVVRRNLKLISFLSITGIMGYNLLSYWSLNFTTAINGSLLNSTSPLFITLFAYMMKRESINLNQAFSVILCFLGVIIVITQGSIHKLVLLNFNIGDLIMLLAVVMWALYSIFLNKAMKIMSPMTVFGYCLIIGFIIMIPLCLAEISVKEISQPSVIDWLALLYLGIFPSLLSILLWNRALALIGAAKSSLYMNLIPLFGIFLSYLVLGEVLAIAQAVGGFLVLAGILYSSFMKSPILIKRGEVRN